MQLGVTSCHWALAGSLCGFIACAGSLSAWGEEAALPPAQRALTADDFYRVNAVSDPEVSPDGRWVAYVVTRSDREADEQRSAIWMVSWDGTQRLAVTAEAPEISKPRWSPDGRFLSFLAAAPGSTFPQVMLLDRRGGEARPLTNSNGDISNYAWSPNGKHLVYSLDPGESRGSAPIVIDALHFKNDDQGYIGTGRMRHLMWVDVDSQQSEALTADPAFDDDLPTWSPDGTTLVFSRATEWGVNPDGRSAIAVMDARPGAPVRVIARPFAPNTQHLSFSPDGRSITYLQGLEPKLNSYIQDQLVLVPAAGGLPHELTRKVKRAIMSYAFSGERLITAVVEDDGNCYPIQIDVDKGTISRAAPPAAEVVASLSAAAGHTALLRTADYSLAEVYALEDGRLRQLSAHNDAWQAGIHWGPVEDMSFKSRDGTEIHALLVKPAEFVAGRRYPTVLWIHGGPNGQDQHELILDGYQFEHQLFAAEGYMVLRVNYRGSTGRDPAFAQAIQADWGHKEVEDLLAGVDALVARGIADPKRLTLGGWSYGGILTDYTIASDQRFKAAISGAGSANQISTWGSDEYILQYNAELGPPWRNQARWLQVSYPFFHADRIHTPTLFLGGDRDFNVPVAGGEQMYEALRTLGVPAQLVVYPGEHHVFTRPSFVQDLAERMSAWIARDPGATGTH